MLWYENPTTLAEAIEFTMNNSACFDFNSLTHRKTPCCDFSTLIIPQSLTDAISDYLISLPKKNYRNLNRKMALLLGECFFIRLTSLVRILSRLFASGDPRENKDLIRSSLKMQIKQREILLEAV